MGKSLPYIRISKSYCFMSAYLNNANFSSTMHIFIWKIRYQLEPGVALDCKIRGRRWPLKQPEINKNWWVKMKTLRVITCSGIPQSSKRGVMNDPKSSKIGGHFCKMCTYDPGAVNERIFDKWFLKLAILTYLSHHLDTIIKSYTHGTLLFSLT